MSEQAEIKAVLLLGHGSRAAGVAEDMERVTRLLRARLDYDIVESCHMSGHGRHFPEACAACVARGATTIIVLPYFLHSGVHLRFDIPRMMQETAYQYPGVRLVLGRHLGFDDSLVAVLEKRLQESEQLGDVRELPASPEEGGGDAGA